MADPSRFATTLRAHRVAIACVAAVALALGLLLAAEAYGDVDTERHVSERTRWSEAAAFSYSVPVTRNSTLYPNGTVLPMGEPAYFRTVSPGVPVNFSWRMEDLGRVGGNLTANLTLRIVAEAGQGRSYWETRHLLDRRASSDPQEGLKLAGYLDLDAEYAEVQALMQQMPPGDGHVNWSIEARVAYDVVGSAGADRGESLYALPVEFADPRVKLPGPDALAWVRPHADTQVTITERPAGWDGVLASPGALALVALGLALGSALAWADLADPTRVWDEREAAFRAELAKQQEWVTKASGQLDPSHMPRPLVDVASLDDLVETAADARTRVLLDEKRRVFYAIGGNATYRYARHAEKPPAPLRPRAVAGPRP